MGVSLLWLAPTLACGSFAPRPTPTTTPVTPVAAFPVTSDGAEAATKPVEQVTPIIIAPTATPENPAVALPTATPTPSPQGGTALTLGQPARVTAPAGLNLRNNPSSSGALLIQLGTGVLVTIVEGPVSAENFRWWKIDDGQGHVGWAADGDNETEWLSPKTGAVQPVNRAPRIGERVLVTMPVGQQLSIRTQPGRDAPLLTRVNPGEQFTISDGPLDANGFKWYRIRSDNGQIEGWAAEGDGATRWLSPLE